LKNAVAILATYNSNDPCRLVANGGLPQMYCRPICLLECNLIMFQLQTIRCCSRHLQGVIIPLFGLKHAETLQ